MFCRKTAKPQTLKQLILKMGTNMEKEIQFMIDGQLAGSATLFIENGEVDTTNAEEKFWKAVCFSKQDLIAEEQSDIIDHLTDAQEEKLKEACMKDYHGDKDHWEDVYEGFIEDLDLDELKKILA